jgi:hypothetical protein
MNEVAAETRRTALSIRPGLKPFSLCGLKNNASRAWRGGNELPSTPSSVRDKVHAKCRPFEWIEEEIVLHRSGTRCLQLPFLRSQLMATNCESMPDRGCD